MQVMLYRRPGLGEAEFSGILCDFADALAGDSPAIDVELAMKLGSEALSDLPHLAETTLQQIPDAILTVQGDRSVLLSCARGLETHLQNAAVPAQCTLLAGSRHSILPGTDCIRLHFGLRRLSRMTRIEFQDYWLNTHADYGRRLIPPYTYHQVHADAVLTDEWSAASGVAASNLDGIVEVHFPDVDAFKAQLSRADVAAEALADERNFIDHSRSVFWIYRTLRPRVRSP